ncbi:probable low-specificity L-threonine aldolase 1, partial [Frieseomelitta varia]|uniref:probable low-specificity L-threonine aldolase 1 n=1 Tax=Frieseomelitta varia TaxID=561572 RepID=UPI001CB68922
NNFNLGAPIGSLLCGTKQFITNARRIRKVLGGGMRQVGVLAAAGLVALEHIPNLVNDHKRAYAFASAINEIRSSVFSVDLNVVQTNIVFMNVDPNVVNASKFANCLREIDGSGDDQVIVKCLALSDSFVRFVFSLEITDDDLMLATKKVTNVIRKLDSKLCL